MLLRWIFGAYILLSLAITAGSARTIAAVASSDRSGRVPFTAEEKAQGFTNRVVLALPTFAGVFSASIDAAESAENLRVVRRYARFDGLRVIEIPEGITVAAFSSRLIGTGRYLSVEPDRIVRSSALASDPEFISGLQWSLRNTGQEGGKAGADIRATEAWDTITDASSVLVAVIDSGVNVTHPDLSENLWRNPGESGNGKETNGIDDDGNGYIDDVHGINATVPKERTGSGNPADDDGVGHGTAVAGVIGAIGNNGIGVSGVAWRAQIMALKFLTSDGIGATSDAIECMDYAVARGAKIINASYGSSSQSAAETAAIQRIKNAGIVFVTSAGNDGLNNDELPHFPSNYPFDNIVAVGASTRADLPHALSNFGSGNVDIFAPGIDIRTLARSPTVPYTTISGTSFAAPQVTGALALLKAKFPEDTPRQSINRLLRGVDRSSAFVGKTLSGGRLNLARALQAETRPFNDNYSERAVLAGGFVSVRTSSNGATREAGEPTFAGSAPAHSLWWDWTAPQTAPVRIDTHGSLLDTVLSVVTGDTFSGLVEVASNDNEGIDRLTSGLTLNAVAGQTYRIAVDGRLGLEGMILLNLRTPPANDSFQAATEVTGPSFRVTQSNIGGTRQVGEPRIDNQAGGRSVWFRWVAPSSGRYQGSVFSDFVDTLLGVYQGDSVGALALVTENDDGQDLLYDPLVTFEAVAGKTYYFSVDSLAAGGKFDFTLVDSQWQKLVVGPIDAPAAGAPDGTVYYAGGLGDLGALDPDGTEKWEFYLDFFASYASPVVGADGTVYVCDEAAAVYAVTPAGKEKWFRAIGDATFSSPALAPDGTLYARAENSPLYALMPDKSLKWTVDIPGASYTSPTIAANGTVYLGSADRRMKAFAPDKVERWSFDAGDEIFASPALDAAGALYFGTIGGRFFAVNPNGTAKWSYLAGGGISSSAAIGVDGALYFGAYDGKLYALNPNGTLRWATAVGTDIRTSSPAIDENGVIYIGTLDGTLVAVNPNGTLRRTYYFARPVRSSPLLLELYDTDGPIAESGPRLSNVSAHSSVGTGADVLITGFVLAGEGNRRILVRAVGPTLGLFGVPGVLGDPVLELYRGDELIATNNDWSGDDGRGAGAFGLADNSKDAVLIRTLAPGVYSAKISGANATTGVALVEVYEW